MALSVLMLVISSYTAFCEVQTVKATNSKKCVEYFTINGQMYCANQPIAPIPSLKEAQANEHNQFIFDGRKWQLGWWDQNPKQPMLEYTLASETADTWTELVTSQYFPGLQNKLTPEQFMKIMMIELVKRGFQPKVRVYAQTPDSVLYEWRIENHPVENQNELVRIMSNAQGLYVLHYASRPNLAEDQRKAWITILSKAKPKL